MREGLKPIYRGKVIDLNLETVELPNKHMCELEIVRHPGGAAALALDDTDRVCLLRQFRHAANGWLWELPAGRLDAGEQPLATAQRELEEEAGLVARRWDTLGTLVSSPAVLSEVIHLYLARELKQVPSAVEPDEVIEVHWLPLSQLLAWANSDEIRDAKTLVGLFRAHDLLRYEASAARRD
jgi:8-oxo-dGTP pyrophosphatase MutT (NUDIX family)